MIARRDFEIVARQIAADLFRNTKTITIATSSFGNLTGIGTVATVAPTFDGMPMDSETVNNEWCNANGMTTMIGAVVIAFKAANPRFREDIFLKAIQDSVHEMYNLRHTSSFLNTPEIG